MASVDQRVFLQEILSDIIHPFFKKWGFKKERVHFIKTEGDVIKMFTVFSSLLNTKKEVRFTFELRIIKDDKGIAETRIGFLKMNADYWYTINKDTDIDKLKGEIALDITKYAKPFFDDYTKYTKQLFKATFW